MGNVYDQLTARDWSSGDAEDRRRAGRELRARARPTRRPGASSCARASSSSTVSRSTPTRWWPWSTAWSTRPNRAWALTSSASAGAKATKIDEYTVDITTGDGRCHLPESGWCGWRSRRRSGSPRMPNDASITQAVGSGPYKLAEYVKGEPLPAQGQRGLLGAEQAEDRRDQDHLPERGGGAGQHDPGRRGPVGHPVDPRGGQSVAGPRGRADRGSRSASGSTRSTRSSRTCGCARRSTWRSIARA